MYAFNDKVDNSHSSMISKQLRCYVHFLVEKRRFRLLQVSHPNLKTSQFEIRNLLNVQNLIYKADEYVIVFFPAGNSTSYKIKILILARLKRLGDYILCFPFVGFCCSRA